MDESKREDAPATETLNTLIALFQELGIPLDKLEVSTCGAQIFKELLEEAEREAKTKTRQR